MGPITLDSIIEEAAILFQNHVDISFAGSFVCHVIMRLPGSGETRSFHEPGEVTNVIHLRPPLGETMEAPFPCVEIQGRPGGNPEYPPESVLLVIHEDYYRMYETPHPGKSFGQVHLFKKGLTPKKMAYNLHRMLCSGLPPIPEE